MLYIGHKLLLIGKLGIQSKRLATDGWTQGQTDGKTDIPSYRVTSLRLIHFLG